MSHINEKDLLLISKPKGITSFDVIRQLQKRFGKIKMGHAGTLDPLAQGLLLVAVSHGTKKLPKLLGMDKEYVAEIELGKQTTTADLEGEVIHQEDVSVEESSVRDVVNNLVGENLLKVPLYSAVKVAGRRLYDYARKGDPVELPERNMVVLESELLSFEGNKLSVRLVVRSGVYVRSLVEEIGKSLGTVAVMTELVRTRIGEFSLLNASSVESVEYDVASMEQAYYAEPAMNICIATGTYPPKVGGTALYAKNIQAKFKDFGHKVRIVTFTIENYLPSGLRHFMYTLKLLFKALGSEVILAMDTFSVYIPTIIVSKILRKKVCVRIGGDFLWEQYTDRTPHKVLLQDFYTFDVLKNLSRKERVIHKLINWALHNTDALIFNTAWQRDIFVKGYGIKEENTFVVENRIGKKKAPRSLYGEVKNFVWVARDIGFKNGDVVRSVFDEISRERKDIVLQGGQVSFEEMEDLVTNAYALILPSISDISPDFILKAVEYNKPFIITKHTGISKDVLENGLLVDPLSSEDIKKKILELSKKEVYEIQAQKIADFDRTHTWTKVAREIEEVLREI
jgi:tRNA pseudouridine55 synthase